MRIVVGCPVYNRAWILDRWYEHLRAWEAAGAELHFAFVVTEGPDATEAFCRGLPRSLVVTVPGPGGERSWGNHDRIHQMVRFRNLLKVVAGTVAVDVEADFFVSLDSDILVSSLEDSYRLFDSLGDIAAPLVFLGAEKLTNAFIYPTRPRERSQRVLIHPDSLWPRGRPVDVVCAAKVMTIPVLLDPAVRYSFDSRGEDFGWAASIHNTAYGQYWMPQVKWKHCMSPEQLESIDRRLGW